MGELPEGPDEVDVDEAKREKIEQERSRLLASLREAESLDQLEAIRDRVAFILSRYPETRDSDVVLAWRYWQNPFIAVADLFIGSVSRMLNHPADHYKDEFARELLGDFGIGIEDGKVVESHTQDVANIIRIG